MAFVRFIQDFKSRLLSTVLSVSTMALALMLPALALAWPFFPDRLSGTWYHDGRPTSIQRAGHGQYLFCNENGQCARGSFTGPTNLQVINWSVVGLLNHRNQVIEWSNGTQWQRNPGPVVNNTIEGRWFHDGRPTHIHVSPNNNQFFLTNEEGQTSMGYVQGRRLTLPSLGIFGSLSPNGDLIRWSNNTTWVR